MITPSPLLRRALLADAVFSGMAAILLSTAASPLARLLQLPEVLLWESGLFLIAYAAFVGWLGLRPAMARSLVLLVVAGNAAWTAGSIGLLLSGLVSPNLMGMLFVVAQAIATGVFAELQFIGLRRSGGVAAV